MAGSAGLLDITEVAAYGIVAVTERISRRFLRQAQGRLTYRQALDVDN